MLFRSISTIQRRASNDYRNIAAPPLDWLGRAPSTSTAAPTCTLQLQLRRYAPLLLNPMHTFTRPSPLLRISNVQRLTPWTIKSRRYASYRALAHQLTTLHARAAQSGEGAARHAALRKATQVVESLEVKLRGRNARVRGEKIRRTVGIVALTSSWIFGGMMYLAYREHKKEEEGSLRYTWGDVVGDDGRERVKDVVLTLCDCVELLVGLESLKRIISLGARGIAWVCRWVLDRVVSFTVWRAEAFP